ncbi:MAG: phenylalanine 4-monooxygenase [Myxococcota bacterium]|nr:phenylalanine 4-monooxygenase [Myxococcota bacterium]
METRLVELDQDHPGFRDPAYRTRRDFIAQIALTHQTGDAVPHAPYTAEEHSVWRTIQTTLAPLHQAHVCKVLNEVGQAMALDDQHIPQLSDINRRLASAGGFRMEPVAGLVSPRIFLEKLADRVFLSTQYIRHYSRPLYTPEPDVVHELVGHAASLIQPDIVALSVAFGRATIGADDATVQQLIRVFWYTLEFGAVEENGKIKAFGAGLLSSAGELMHFADQAELRSWDLARIAETPFDPTTYQPQIYVAPSFETMVSDLSSWLDTLIRSN